MNLIALSQVLMLQQRISDMMLQRTQYADDQMATTETVGKLTDMRLNYASRSEAKRFFDGNIVWLNQKLKHLQNAMTSLDANLATARQHLADARNQMRQDQQSGAS